VFCYDARIVKYQAQPTWTESKIQNRKSIIDMTPLELLLDAKAGNSGRLGELLEHYRRYLSILARVQLGQRLQGKLDASDLVQDVFLEAHRHFPKFEGQTEGQFLAWLRQILAATLANLLRRYLGTQGRDVRLERELAAELAQSSRVLDGALVAGVSSPSQQASKREQAVILADALADLPEDYREVVLLRNLQGLSFPDVAQRMGRTVDSVEKLWLRALIRLRQKLGTPT
jgi:RNA polymerase sigma-70 factor, ECF subfamily